MSALLILYGSEKGNSTLISKRIYQDCIERGFQANWQCLSDYTKVSHLLKLDIFFFSSPLQKNQEKRNTKKNRKRKGKEAFFGLLLSLFFLWFFSHSSLLFLFPFSLLFLTHTLSDWNYRTTTIPKKYTNYYCCFKYWRRTTSCQCGRILENIKKKN